MPEYFYITMLCIVIISAMIHEIYLYSKGKYYPYLTGNKEDSFKKRLVNVGFIIVTGICISHLPPDTLPDYIPLIFLIALSVFFSILNCLSYAKIKDRKIIYQTVILNISIIALVLIVEYVLPY